MTEVLSPPTHTSSLSPNSTQTTDNPKSVEPRQPRERVTSYAQNRMSQVSRSSQRSRPQSTVAEYPAFTSTLPYAQVRDFAYPVFHPLHYGAPPEESGASTPGSEWNAGRRQSDPMDQWNSGGNSHSGGWSAGPWGGDGAMYGDPEDDVDIAALPSTSFGSAGEGNDFENDDYQFKKGKHRKSKSYASISDFERGRRRESSRKSRNAEAEMFYFGGQQSDLAGRDSLRQSRGHDSENGPRRDSRNSATLPHRSFHRSFDPDEHIPLDTEPHSSHSPVRDSMGPEDEELFAGPSLALYSFEPENSNELRLVEGQEIMVSYRHGQGWLVASDPRSGEQGLVPEAYVRLIADMPNYDPETGQFVDVEDEMDDEDGAMIDLDDALPDHQPNSQQHREKHEEPEESESSQSSDSPTENDDDDTEEKKA